MIPTRSFLTILVGLATVSLAERAAAVTYTFQSSEPGAYQMFEGTFDAFDLNADNRITTDEVTSFSAKALGGSQGGPGGWHVIVTPATETFFNIGYDLDGVVGNSATEFLEFGYRRTITCSDYVGGPQDQVRTITGVASLNSVTLPSGLNPYGACPASDGATQAFPSIAASVSYDLSVDTATVPLPFGALLLASALGVAAFRSRRGRG